MTQDTILRQTIAEELELQNLPKEQKAKALADFRNLVTGRLYMETMDRLAKEDQEEFAKMFESKARQTEIESYLGEKIASYDEFVAKVVGELRGELARDRESFANAHSIAK